LLGNDDYTGNRFQIFDDFYCKYEFPKGEKQAIAYFEYFLMPYSEKSPHRGQFVRPSEYRLMERTFKHFDLHDRAMTEAYLT
ncbi:hypothetical protein ACQ1RH_11325, partial [Ornithobacterium rhinotracheale]